MGPWRRRAILGDRRRPRAGRRPAAYTKDLWGGALRFSYPIVKRTITARRAELEVSRTPFATVVLAHLAAQDTQADAPRRQVAKLTLTRRLYQGDYSRERVLSLYRFIDWLLELPDVLEQAFWQDGQELEEERAMPYLTTIERRGLASRAWSKASVTPCGASWSPALERCPRRWRNVSPRPTARRWTCCSTAPPWPRAWPTWGGELSGRTAGAALARPGQIPPDQQLGQRGVVSHHTLS